MVLHGLIEPCIELARKNVTIVLCEPMELQRENVPRILHGLMELNMKEVPTVLCGPMEQPGNGCRSFCLGSWSCT